MTSSSRFMSLFEHDLFGKTGTHFSGSCSEVVSGGVRISAPTRAGKARGVDIAAESGRQHLVHFADQFAKVNRLREHLGVPGRIRIGVQGYRGEAGDEHDLDVGVELGSAAR